MKFIVSILVLFIFIAYASAMNSSDSLQLAKENALVDTLKKHASFNNSKSVKDNNIYCVITFRGLSIEISGINQKSGGTIYINSIGKNQSIIANCKHCITIIFRDVDLQGTLPAHIIITDNGAIAHNYGNTKLWAECN
jgi:hypothetical protein